MFGKPRHWNPIGRRSFALDPISSQGCGGLALDPSPSEGCRGFALDQRLCFGSNSVSMRPSLISCTFGPTILRRRLFYERGSKSPLLEALLVKLRVLKFPAVHHNVAGVKEAWVSFFHVQQVRYHLEVFDRSISRPIHLKASEGLNPIPSQGFRGFESDPVSRLPRV